MAFDKETKMGFLLVFGIGLLNLVITAGMFVGACYIVKWIFF